MNVPAFASAGMRRYNGEEINQTGYRRQSRSNATGDHKIKSRGPERPVATDFSNHVQDDAHHPQPDRKRHEHGMDRVRLNAGARSHNSPPTFLHRWIQLAPGGMAPGRGADEV